MKVTLTPTQWLGCAIIVLGVLSGGTAQLTTIFGAGATQVIVAICSLANGIVGGFIMVLSGQSSIVQQVQAMPGVEKITVNAQANATLAGLAVDPTQAKIEATPQATAAVQRTAAAS